MEVLMGVRKETLKPRESFNFNVSVQIRPRAHSWWLQHSGEVFFFCLFVDNTTAEPTCSLMCGWNLKKKKDLGRRGGVKMRPSIFKRSLLQKQSEDGAWWMRGGAATPLMHRWCVWTSSPPLCCNLSLPLIPHVPHSPFLSSSRRVTQQIRLSLCQQRRTSAHKKKPLNLINEAFFWGGLVRVAGTSGG